MSTVYVRCPDCQGYSADPRWGDNCELCGNAGSVSEEYLIEALGDEGVEILDYYYRRGKFKNVKPGPLSPFMKGWDA